MSVDVPHQHVLARTPLMAGTTAIRTVKRPRPRSGYGQLKATEQGQILPRHCDFCRRRSLHHLADCTSVGIGPRITQVRMQNKGIFILGYDAPGAMLLETFSRVLPPCLAELQETMAAAFGPHRPPLQVWPDVAVPHAVQ